jgi:hypothetical protein
VHGFQGPTGEFLEHPSGDPTTNLLALAREGLHAPLRAVVQLAIHEKQEVVADARVRRGGALHPVRIAVRPLRPARTDQGMLTVSFFEREPVAETRPPGPVEERRPESELEAELNATREELRFTLEQMGTSNAELQASNEEIRSINEEFQATNEELETSKEELQSLNEELRTVNNQFQVKVQELKRRTNDLNNLLNSTTSPNTEGAKAFLRYLLQPEQLGPYLEATQRRFFPPMPKLLERPFWQSGSDPHVAALARQLAGSEKKFVPSAYNWKYQKAEAERVWPKAVARIVVDNWSAEAAVDEAITRSKQIMSE